MKPTVLKWNYIYNIVQASRLIWTYWLQNMHRVLVDISTFSYVSASFSGNLKVNKIKHEASYVKQLFSNERK